MTAGIIAILAALVPFIIWLWKRHDAAEDDPKTQNQERYAQIDQDIAKGDGIQAGVHGSDDLDTLDRLRNGQGNQLGSNPNQDAKGPSVNSAS